MGSTFVRRRRRIALVWTRALSRGRPLGACQVDRRAQVVAKEARENQALPAASVRERSVDAFDRPPLQPVLIGEPIVFDHPRDATEPIAGVGRGSHHVSPARFTPSRRRPCPGCAESSGPAAYHRTVDYGQIPQAVSPVLPIRVRPSFGADV